MATHDVAHLARIGDVVFLRLFFFSFQIRSEIIFVVLLAFPFSDRKIFVHKHSGFVRILTIFFLVRFCAADLRILLPCLQRSSSHGNSETARLTILS